MASGIATDSTAVVAMVHDIPKDAACMSRLLMDCLDRFTGTARGDVVIRRPRGRRPTARLDGRTIYLSLSHSAELAATAASLHPVGIDIERVRTVRNVDGVGAHIAGFMPRHDGGPSTADPHTEVLSGWTRYEAAVKALGVGRTLVPSEFSCNGIPDLTFRGLELPLKLSTARLSRTGGGQCSGYLLSVAARPTSNVVITHGSDLGYTPVTYERQES